MALEPWLLDNPVMDIRPAQPPNSERQAGSVLAAVVLEVARYLRDNPIAGLRAPLRGAPIRTWSLVPVFVIAALTLGLWTGRLEPEWPSVWQVLFLPLVLALFPTLVEEFFYRGMLLPRSLLTAGPWRRFLALSASTLVYVSVHPISPLLGRSELDFFLDPWMLLVVALLGYSCGYAYLRSASLRAPMLIHWATVVVWNLFLGGVY